MYTLNEVLCKQEEAIEAGLSGAELLDDTERAIRVCNGIGAAWMPEWLRALISKLFPTLVLAADIHDIRYDMGGDEIDRHMDDVEMLDNGIKLANRHYGRLDPRRYIVQFVMLQFYIKLRDYGQAAYNFRETR
jgi:hypothetical protein